MSELHRGEGAGSAQVVLILPCPSDIEAGCALSGFALYEIFPQGKKMNAMPFPPRERG